MTEADLNRAARFEAEARELHCRSRAAATLPGSILLRFRALWKRPESRMRQERTLMCSPILVLRADRQPSTSGKS